MKKLVFIVVLISLWSSCAIASKELLLADLPRGATSAKLLLASADSNRVASPKTPSQPKSGLKAALLSAALPGLGQLYLDEKGRGQFFLIAEGATWATFAAFQIYSHWKEQDFERLAMTDAGVDVSNRSDDYVDVIAFYNNVDEYNALGRISEPDRAYIDPNDTVNAWYWSDPAQRNTFRQLKNSSREASRRSQFAFGLAIVNRAASVIDALISARKSIKKGIDNQFSFLEDVNMHLSVHPEKPERAIKLTWYPGL